MGGCVSKAADVHDVKSTQATAGGTTVAKERAAQSADAAAALLGTNLSTPVQLSISCEGLKSMDLFSKSDPMAVLYIANGRVGTGRWLELGRTEFISNTASPKFVTKVRAHFHFEEVQHLMLQVFDVDTRCSDVSQLNLAKQDFLGQAFVRLADVVSQPSGVKLSLSPSKHLSKTQSNAAAGRNRLGTAIVVAEEVNNANANVTLVLSAQKLANLDTFSKSDPFVRFSTIREDGTLDPVYKTEVINDNLNPKWRDINITLRALCNGDMHRPLRLEVFDYDRDGSHDLIGMAQTSIAGLHDNYSSTGREVFLPLTLPPSHKNVNYKSPAKSRGTLIISRCEISPRPSFLDYIRGGCELNFMIGIDFTASNGQPSDPRSLHYIHPNFSLTGAYQPQYTAQYSQAPGSDSHLQLNQYQAAIVGVSEVMEHYDSDKVFQVYGFGASLSPNTPTSHAFTLTGDPNNPNVHGVQGIHMAYSCALTSSTMKLSGPTLFAPLIKEATRQAAVLNVSQQNQKYLCLLILTDGCIMDMEPTKRAIIDACAYPISILIVGVGEADFSAMRELDGDMDDVPIAPAKRRNARQQHQRHHRLRTADGMEASRDIVQFVSFREFASVLHLPPGSAVGQALAQELLAELPDQVLSFMKSRKILPNAPRLQHLKTTNHSQGQMPSNVQQNAQPPNFSQHNPMHIYTGNSHHPSYTNAANVPRF